MLVRVGVAPAVISVVCLRVMRPRDAADLFLTGQRVSAERALDAGLLNRVVPAADLDHAIDLWIEHLRLGGPTALAATKQLLRQVPTTTRDEGFAFTAELSAALFAGAEAAEGMTAFVERRPPRWASS